MVLNLEVRRFLDLEALEHGLTIYSFRLWMRVQFQRHEVPVVLGCHGFLDCVKLTLDGSRQLASVEL